MTQGLYLKPGYIERVVPHYFEDEEDSEWQPDVYPFALGLLGACGASKVIDIGCGKAGKLKPFFEANVTVMGIDYDVNISYSRAIPRAQPDNPLHQSPFHPPPPISTPERDLEYGVQHSGPPPNEAHVREWNRTELETLLKAAGLKVLHVGLTRAHTSHVTLRTTLAVIGRTQ